MLDASCAGTQIPACLWRDAQDGCEGFDGHGGYNYNYNLEFIFKRGVMAESEKILT